eukprot:5585745-Amphidinium_carterae.1
MKAIVAETHATTHSLTNGTNFTMGPANWATSGSMVLVWPGLPFHPTLLFIMAYLRPVFQRVHVVTPPGASCLLPHQERVLWKSCDIPSATSWCTVLTVATVYQQQFCLC